MIVKESLERLKRVSSEGRATANPKGAHVYDALDQAIVVTEKHLPSLEILGEPGIRSAMRTWLTPSSYEAKRALILGASMTELAEGNLRDAWELDQDTEKRAQVRRDLVEWLTEIGVVGVRLLLAVAFV